MAKFTNKYGAHKAIARAVEYDNHVVHGDISVTQLMKAPMERWLYNKFKGDPRIQRDVRDQFWMLFGTICHEILEKGNNFYSEYYKLKQASMIMKRLAETENEKKAAAYVAKFAEKKFAHKLDKELFLERTMSMDYHGVTISGTQDIYHAGNGVLEDWKTCLIRSTWYYEADKIEWEIQQNIYAYMLRRQGYKVRKIRILAIFRDWSQVKFETSNKKGVGYPAQPWAFFELPIWPDEKVEAYLDIRLEAYRTSLLKDKPRDCNAKERWSKNDEFAVIQRGGTRAVRVFDSKERAEDYITEHGHRLDRPWIEERWGFDLKCRFYCPVSSVCDLHQSRKGNKGHKDVKKERPQKQLEIEQAIHEENKKDEARSFSAKEFLRKNYNTMKEYRADKKDLYDEEDIKSSGIKIQDDFTPPGT